MKKIRLSKCSLNKSVYSSVKKILDSDFLGMGPEVKKFEDSLKKKFKRKTVCVSSGTAALHLSIEALDLSKDAEIIIPSNTYVAGLQAILASNKKPVLCDINYDDLSMSIEDLEAKITKKTKVIMPTLYSGDPGNILDIYKLAKKYNLRVIEDAAHAFGSFLNKKLIGTFGDIVCFSFDGIKNITSGEGGCVVSKDEKIIRRVQESRFLGIIKESSNRYKKKKQFEFDVKYPGWRYHMSDIMASIGIAQLKQLNSFRKKRQKIARKYVDLLSKNKNISILNYNFDEICPHIFVIISKKKINRIKLKNYFEKKNIEIGFHWKPLHELTVIKKNYKFKNLNNSKKLRDRILTLPIHVDLSIQDILYVVKHINRFFNGK
tara:strand:+ start:4930 stop:6057 length:1128 start_codon:yes stop_codon:yes gene_type:complete